MKRLRILNVLGAACLAGVAFMATPARAQDGVTVTTSDSITINKTGKTIVKNTNVSSRGAKSTGLTQVQFLALQQQLRDDGCGIDHVTGVLDAQTRSAIAKCKTKYGVTGSAKDLLVAMNIGFDVNMSETGMGAIMGDGSSK